jgi:hypothetical protein
MVTPGLPGASLEESLETGIPKLKLILLTRFLKI